MSEIFSAGRKSIVGPWLLGITELEELGNLFELFYKKLYKAFDEDIYEKIKNDGITGKKEIKKAHDRILKIKTFGKKVVLTSKDGTRIIDDSLNNILQDPKISTFEPVRLQFWMKFDFEYEFTLSIENREDGKLEYAIECKKNLLQDEIKYDLDKWLDKHKPNKAMQIWNKHSYWIGLLGYMIFFLALIKTFTSNQTPDAKTFYKNEITELLKTGINENNEMKALEIILKLSSDYIPQTDRGKWKLNRFTIYIFSLSFFLLIFSIFFPKTTFGIGKYKERLNIYKIYTKTVLVFVPTMIILPIILNKLFP